MYYQEYTAPPVLNQYIKSFWTLEHDYSKPPMMDGERIWPDGHFEMIFTYDNPYYRILNGVRKQVPENFLIGQFNTELLLDSAGKTGLFAVRFHAWGLYPLLKHSLRTYTNKLTDLYFLFGNDIRKLKGSLSTANREESINRLSNFISERISDFSPDGEVIIRIAREINDNLGNVQISSLMDKFQISERKIQKLFLEQVGISAKHFAKIIRFREAKKLIERNPEVNLAALTYACGYSDQPHFIKNFKELFGISPSQHKKRVIALSTYFEQHQ